MATEALQRLRDEINAAFDAHRRPISKPTRLSTSPPNLTSKWSQVTSLLASAGQPPPSSPDYPVSRRFSPHQRPQIDQICASKLREMTEGDKIVLLRGFFSKWRQKTQSAAQITMLYIRARKRQELRFLSLIFKVWRRRTTYELQLKTAAKSVKNKSGSGLLAATWKVWRRVQHRQMALREFQLKITRRLSCRAFNVWVMTTEERVDYRRSSEMARIFFLRRHWRYLEAGLEVLRRLDDDLEEFASWRTVRLMERCLISWEEYVEQCKRWQFAVQWSERRALEDAYDYWREGHRRVRRIRHTLQLATRRRRRSVLRQMLRYWCSHVLCAQSRRQALATVIRAQLRRLVFMRLVANTRYGQERDASLQSWKMRRSIWTWLHRSYKHRTLRLRAVFLQENHNRLLLRSVVWRPWRCAYLRSIKLRKLTSYRRLTQLRKAWKAFVAGIHLQKQQHVAIESIEYARRQRSMQCIINEWRARVSSARYLKNVSGRISYFYHRLVLWRAMTSWKVAREEARRVRELDAVARTYLTRRMVHHWARWAYWSRREIAGKINAVLERRRRQQMQRCIFLWRQEVEAHHATLCYVAFTSWKAAIIVLQRQRQLADLCRIVQLRWRWRRWGVLVNRCQVMRANMNKVQKVHGLRLLRRSFISVWLSKTRGYQCGSRLLTNFANRRTLRYVLARWRQNQLRLSALRRAHSFYSGMLRSRHFHLLYVFTIGQKRTAVAHARHHVLVCSWGAWHRHVRWKQHRREAEAHFQWYMKRKAVRLLREGAANALERRSQLVKAEAWHEAVVMQAILSKWLKAANHARRCRMVGEELKWRQVGRRALNTWQDAWVERQQVVKAEQFRASVLISRSWSALLRVTKRRQVAVVMWGHAMEHIRLENVFVRWKRYTNSRRDRYALATIMHRMQQQRICQHHFSAWALVILIQTQAQQRQQRESLRWRRVCWMHWKLWRITCRWRRSQHSNLLHAVFCRGLQRHAVQQQAAREICTRTARSLLQRTLARWRVEWWLIRSQKKLANGAKRTAFSHWVNFTSGCHQKRRWVHYVQQLHRSQVHSKTEAAKDKRAAGGIFRDTRALQAQLKRCRVLMTHVLHAWYLVAHSRHRHNQCQMHSIPNWKQMHPLRVTQRTSRAERHIALEFWAQHVMRGCFEQWKGLTTDAFVHPEMKRRNNAVPLVDKGEDALPVTDAINSSDVVVESVI